MDALPTRWIPDSENDMEFGSAQSYEAWTYYRDMPPHKRSVRGALRVFQEDAGEDEGSYGSWIHWSHKYKWKERVREIDEEVASYRLGERIAAQQRIDAEELELGDAAIAIAVQRIEEMDPAEINAAHLEKWVKGFSDVRRRAVMTEDSDWNAERHLVDVRERAKSALLEKLGAITGKLKDRE